MMTARTVLPERRQQINTVTNIVTELQTEMTKNNT